MDQIEPEYKGYKSPAEIQAEEYFDNLSQEQTQPQGQDPSTPPSGQQVEQPQAQEQPQEQPVEQPVEQISPLDEGFDLGDGARNVVEGATAPLLGVADTAFDLAGVLGFKKADEWWDQTSPRSTNPWIKAIRDLSGVVIPSIVLSRLGVRGANKLTAGAQLSQRTRVAGEIAMDLGADAAVASVASSAGMYDNENIGNAMEQVFGINVPWAIRDGDSADVKYAKNMAENTSIGGFLGLVSGFFSIRKAQKLVRSGTDEVVQTATDAAQTQSDDAVLNAIDTATATKRSNEVDQGVRNLQADPDGVKGYDPYINTPAEDTARPASGQTIDPLQAKVDNFRMQNNIGTTNGTASPVVSKGFQDFMMTNTDPGVGVDEYIDMARQQSEKVDLIFNGKRFRAEELALSEEKLVDVVNGVATGEVSQAEFTDIFRKAYNTNNIGGVEVLNESAYKVVAKAFSKVFTSMDPAVRKSRSYAAQQAATETAQAAKAVEIVGEFADSTQQQMRSLNALEFMYQEMAFNRKVSSEMLRNKRLVDIGESVPEEELLEQVKRLEEFRTQAIQEAINVRETAEKITKENPEYFKPFFEVLQSTNGDVDTLFKLRQYFGKRTAFWRKAFMDGDTKVPSYLIQALQSIKYGNILMARAPVAAAIGNTTLIALKPINMFAGASNMGDVKEALWTFGGFQENFWRGAKAFANEWREVTRSPLAAAKRQRTDVGSMEKYLREMDAMEAFYEAERKNGNTSGEFGYRATKMFSWIANTNLMRFGANAMTAIDGFTKSFIASGEARNRAYRELFPQLTQLSPADFQKAFDAKQRAIYDSMFDKTGMLIDDAAGSQSKAITMQQDIAGTGLIDQMTAKFPMLKPLFMFPRTGMNALNMSWSYVPKPAFMGGITRQGKILRAKTNDEILDALRAHGMDPTADGFDTYRVFENLKSEYIGRQRVGAVVIAAAGMWALNGNLTGAGPRDGALRRRMIKYQDWQPFSIRNPFNGDWVSYQGFEPFSTQLGLVADVVWHSAAGLDQDITEDYFRKIMYSMTSNVTNKSFLSGLEPLNKLLNGDEGAWNSFLAREMDSFFPGTSVRGVLNEVMYPQAIEVERDLTGYLKARNKWLTGNMGLLAPAVDIYTGEEIKMGEPIQMFFNALTSFKSNTGSEPWRQYVTSIGWEGLPPKVKNPLTGIDMTPEETLYINNWIGKNMPMKDVILDIMSEDPQGEYRDQVLALRDERRRLGAEKAEINITNAPIHRILDKALQTRINAAFNYMRQENLDGYAAGQLRGASQDAQRRGDAKKAGQLLEEARKLGY